MLLSCMQILSDNPFVTRRKLSSSFKFGHRWFAHRDYCPLWSGESRILTNYLSYCGRLLKKTFSWKDLHIQISRRKSLIKELQLIASLLKLAIFSKKHSFWDNLVKKINGQICFSNPFCLSVYVFLRENVSFKSQTKIWCHAGPRINPTSDS